MRVENGYGRCGAWAYLAALDVHHARIFGRVESTTGIAPFTNVVEQVMTRPPYKRLQAQFPKLVLVHTPIHVSYLSIIQRKVFTPNNFQDLGQLAERLFDFQYHWEATARPFEWKYTKTDLAKLLAKLHKTPALSSS
jgi:hypothetical protein